MASLTAPHPSAAAPAQRTPWYRVLYVQVLIAIAIGVLVGYMANKSIPKEDGRIDGSIFGLSLDSLFNVKIDQSGPKESLSVFLFGHEFNLTSMAASFLKFADTLAKIFINLIKMMIAPIIFCTIVHGIASIGDLKKVGRVGLKALIYFEVVSSVALLVGILVGEFVRPGANFGADIAKLDPKAVAEYANKAAADSVGAHILAIIPKSYVDAFAGGDLLQVLLVAILTGIVLSGMGEKGERLTHGIEAAGQVFFRIIGIIVKLAPIGAFGAMAFTIGQYGIAKVVDLAWLVGSFYATSLLFVILVLGGIAAFCGFSIFRFLAYIKDELLIVLGTSSSETVLPHIMTKMKRLGASDSVVGLVVPTGYSFNLDGTNIYMTLTTLFLAQAVGANLTFDQYATIFLVAMLTSKGASGVTGAGFVTLAATLGAIPNNPVPVAAMTLVLGIDKFMSECRALTNLIGNGVATIVVSRWEGELDRAKLNEVLKHPIAIGTEISHDAPTMEPDRQAPQMADEPKTVLAAR